MEWMDFVNLGVNTLLAAIKNKKRKDQVKAIALKVRNSINQAFAGDPDFAE